MKIKISSIKKKMPTLELELFEKIYFGVIIAIFLGVILMAYRLTRREYQNLSMSLIFSFAILILMLIVPEAFLWLLFLAFTMLMFNMVFGTFIAKFSGLEEDKLLIDKASQVWESFETPPELKEESP
jgi:hypothetical protein